MKGILLACSSHRSFGAVITPDPGGVKPGPIRLAAAF